MLYLGSDHRGFELKTKLMKYLDSVDIEFEDLGYFKKDDNDDYNEIAEELSRYVRLSNEHQGILICGTGVGVNIVSNKHREIRSALVFNDEVAKLAREHEGANIACLPADFISFDEAKQIVTTFIKTPFSMAPRHTRRISKIIKLEENGLA